VLAEGIRLAPGDVSFRTASMMIAMRQRQFEKVTSLARAAQQAGAVDACVFGLLGHALSSLARHGDALDAYTEALKLAPEDPYVRHLVTAGGVLPHAARAPAEYLETVFDGYAERFEHHLIGLGYRVPGLVRNALLAHVPIPGNGVTGPVLDLGCGTGLVGVVLSDLPFGPLVGVDLSGAMLEQARAKSLYAELHQADLEAVLADDTRNWPVIVAADVFCYFGDLAPVLSQAARRLVPGGVMVFSVEELLAGAEPWRLGRQGRYAHSRAHVLEAVAGTELALRELRPETLRYEADTAVSGMLVVLERPNHGS
jgi:predicted TPR repeat methyltransferase